MAKAATLLGVQDPFDPAGQMLHELTGQRLSERTVARLIGQAGAQAAKLEKQQALAMAKWQAPPAETHPERLYVTVDGTMVHQLNDWHKAKCVTCYWEEPDGNRQARCGARFTTASEFVAYVWALSRRCGLETAEEAVLLGDGAEWIWNQVGSLLKGATCIVDWYHAPEHVWACGRALHGGGADQTKSWVSAYETLLWEGQVRTILRRLRDEKARARAGPNSCSHGAEMEGVAVADHLHRESGRPPGLRPLLCPWPGHWFGVG